MEKYNELEALMTELKADMEKFYDKGNKAAGVRARKGLQSIKALAQEIRADISEKRK